MHVIARDRKGAPGFLVSQMSSWVIICTTAIASFIFAARSHINGLKTCVYDLHSPCSSSDRRAGRERGEGHQYYIRNTI